MDLVTITKSTATVRRDGEPVGRILAEYRGGAYVDLTFTTSLQGHIPSRPIEVINVWNYERNVSRIRETNADVSDTLKAWIGDMNEDAEWATWFEDYVRNAR